jgi:MoaA/NifB/PqqE/SkfB family radical SAM enzyme
MDNTKENRYSGFFCPVPFESIYIDYHGNMNPHCEGLVTVSMGNLKVGNFSDVWNSEAAQKIRESILDGSFQYCHEQRCWALQEGRIPRVEEINNPAHRNIIRNRLKVLKKGPAALNLGYDSTCNLVCRSCRKEPLSSESGQKAAEIIHRKTIGSHLKDVKRVVMSCMGEPLASKLNIGFLQSYDPSRFPEMRIQIVTNGLLLTPEMWDALSSCHSAIDNVCVSVDAATWKTYQINRGGDFKALMENLNFIAHLRKEQAIKEFVMDFVVQANNYTEMKSFVELGRKYGCDWVAFKHIENWGTFTDREFREIAVHEASHPEHRKFLSVLTDPVMKDPIVWMRNLTPFIPEDNNEDGLLKLCDAEVFNLILHDMEWDFFRSKLSLNDMQSFKIWRILNNMKDNITEIYSYGISEEIASPLEYVSGYATTALEMDEGSLLARCKEYALREMDHFCESAYAGVEKLVLERENEIMHFLSNVQQNTFRQLIRIKPLTAINTGYSPLRQRLDLLSGKQVDNLN